MRYIEMRRFKVPPELEGMFAGKPKSLFISGDYSTHAENLADYLLKRMGSGKKSFTYSFRNPQKVSRARKNDFSPKYIDQFSLVHSAEALKGIYDFAATLPRRSTLFVRQLDDLILEYRMKHDPVSVEEVVYVLHRDLVEIAGLNLLFTSSYDNAELRRIVDGFVTVNIEDVSGYKFHTFTVEHVGGRYHGKSYFMGFEDGKYLFYPPEGRIGDSELKVSGGNCEVSTGIADLDDYVGCLSPGSYNVVEIENGVPDEVYLVFLYALIVQNLKGGRGVILAPSGRFSADEHYMQVKHYAGENARYLKIIKNTPLAERKSYVVDGYSRTPEDRHEIWKNVMQYLNRISSGPVIDITEYGTIEAKYSGNELITLVSEGVNWLSEWGAVGIGILPEGSEVRNRLMHLSRTYLRIYNHRGFYMVEGVKPPKPPMLIQMFESDGLRVHLRRLI